MKLSCKSGLLMLCCVLALSARGQQYVDFTINMPQQLMAHAGQDVSMAQGNSAVLGANPAYSGGVSPYDFLWTPHDSLDNPLVANPTANPVSTKQYVLQVSDGNYCTANDTVVVTVFPTGVAASETAFPVIYFNPETKLLRIDFRKKLSAEDFQIKLFDNTGRLCASNFIEKGTNLLDIRLDGHSGMYLLSLQSSQTSFSVKLVIP